MKKLLFLIAVLGTSVAMAQNSEKAKNLLDQVYNKVKSYDNIYVDFKYTLNNAEANINQETRGDVTMQGDKYLFNYLGSQQMYDGSKV
ncbi:MAG: outer membrane lipoprotein carrier protein LolA, partial [Bacteroidota bacterium]